MRVALPFIALLLGACSYHGGMGGSSYPPGSTQGDVAARLPAGERVLYRDREMMIVEGPAGTRQLRFDAQGRLQTDMPHGRPGGVR